MAIHLTFIRHGEYNAHNGNLTHKGIYQVEESAKTLTATFDPGQRALVYSSPQPRAQGTASTAIQVLIDHGVGVVGGSWDILPDLDEVRGFSWIPLLSSLVQGGVARFSDDEIYEIEKSLTNPDDLSPGRYFNHDYCHRLSEDVRAKLPAGYLVRVDAMELYSSTFRRFRSMLRMIATHHAGTAYRIVAAGHYASSSPATEVFTGGAVNGLENGQSLDIVLTDDGKAYVTRVGSLTEGCSETDLFTAAYDIY